MLRRWTRWRLPAKRPGRFLPSAAWRRRRATATGAGTGSTPWNTTIEVYPRVGHFAPCRVSEDGFQCLVVLERGVNSPIDVPGPGADGEDKLLWMRGKWMTCHAESPQAEKGAFIGITGENWDLEI